jgi:hypothetical protein
MRGHHEQPSRAIERWELITNGRGNDAQAVGRSLTRDFSPQPRPRARLSVSPLFGVQRRHVTSASNNAALTGGSARMLGTETTIEIGWANRASDLAQSVRRNARP